MSAVAIVAGPDAEQDRDEHRRAGPRHEERQDRAAGRELVGEGRDEEDEPEQRQDLGPVPELRAEAPDPGEQEDDDEGGEEEPAGDAGDVERRLRRG